MNSGIVKELIQQDCTPEKIGSEIDLILNQKTYRETMLDNYEKTA